MKSIKSAIKLYPNPADDNCVITLSSKTTTETEVVVIDVTGAEVYRQKILTNQSVNIRTNWAPGVYYFSANVGGERLTCSLIVR